MVTGIVTAPSLQMRKLRLGISLCILSIWTVHLTPEGTASPCGLCTFSHGTFINQNLERNPKYRVKQNKAELLTLRGGASPESHLPPQPSEPSLSSS